MIKEKIQKAVAIILTAALTSTMMPCTSAKSAGNISKKAASLQSKPVSDSSKELKSTYSDVPIQVSNSKTGETDETNKTEETADIPEVQDGQRAIYSGTCGTNLTWELDTDTGVLNISGNGAMYGYSPNYFPWSRYTSYVKSLVIGDGVTSITESAFDNCSALTSITVGSGVTSIGGPIFAYCRAIKSITVNNDYVLKYFRPYITETLTIGDKVTSIGNAVRNNVELKSVTIGGGVTSIGNEEFYNCASLTSITIPDSVTSIGDNAFYECRKLTSITIPDSVTSIGDNAFYACSKLTSITIPDSVTSIGKNAFIYCSALKSVTLNNDYAVNNFKSKICCPYTEVETVIIGDGVTSIGDNAFANCRNLTSVTIGSGVTSIGNNAFANCKNLTSVTIGSGVTSIGNRPFGRLDYVSADDTRSPIKSVTLNNDYAVSRFKSVIPYTVETVTIGSGVTSIGENIFNGYSTLETINVDENNSNYKSIDGLLLNKACTELLFCPNGKVSVTVPNSVTSIGENAFNGCSKLETINVDENNSNYKSSSDGILLNKAGTELIRCPSGKVSVTIPSSVNSIVDNAFKDCSALKSATLNSEYAVNNFKSKLPYSKIETVIIGDGVTSIGNNAFKDCSALKSVTIPNVVVSIGDSSFARCSGLTTIEIPNSVTSIGKVAFGGCSGLTTIEIPNAVTSIGHEAFRYCSGLTTIEIPNSVTSIGGGAFYNCRGLTSVTIPDSVTSIGEGAFSECGELKTVIFNGKKGPSIDDCYDNSDFDVFDKCNKLSKVKVPEDYEGDTFCGVPVERPSDSSKGSKLSGGAVAGIVIGCLTAVAATVGGVLLVRHHLNQSQINKQSSSEMIDVQQSA